MNTCICISRYAFHLPYMVLLTFYVVRTASRINRSSPHVWEMNCVELVLCKVPFISVHSPPGGYHTPSLPHSHAASKSLTQTRTTKHVDADCHGNDITLARGFSNSRRVLISTLYHSENQILSLTVIPFVK